MDDVFVLWGGDACMRPFGSTAKRNLWQRMSVRIGFAMPNSAFGRIGGRSANRSRAIGMRVTCTIRVIGSMTCT